MLLDSISIMDEDGFEWDPKKAAANVKKHKIDFQAARRVFDDLFAYIEEDTSEDYGEERRIAIGMVDDLLIAVVFTERGEQTRIISARKANSHEQRRYYRSQTSF